MANTIDTQHGTYCKLERKENVMSSFFLVDDDLNSAVSTYTLLQQPH